MKFPEDRNLPSALSPSISGALVTTRTPIRFTPRLPSTWPPVTRPADDAFIDTLERLFLEGMLAELNNVCADILASNPSGLQGRGHVFAVAMMSMLEALSKFAFPTKPQHERIPEFVEKYFPPNFHPIRQQLSDDYRNGLIHEWFMKTVAFLPGSEPIIIQANGAPVLGLLTFKAGLTESITNFLADLRTDPDRRAAAADRYHTLQSNALS